MFIIKSDGSMYLDSIGDMTKPARDLLASKFHASGLKLVMSNTENRWVVMPMNPMQEFEIRQKLNSVNDFCYNVASR